MCYWKRYPINRQTLTRRVLGKLNTIQNGHTIPYTSLHDLRDLRVDQNVQIGRICDRLEVSVCSILSRTISKGVLSPTYYNSNNRTTGRRHENDQTQTQNVEVGITYRLQACSQSSYQG